jgi:hypothetical protein
MRQGANSAIRFTTYSTLKQFVQGAARPGQTLPSTITFGIGAIAGLVTVYSTMPLECGTSYLWCALSDSFQCRQNPNAEPGSPGSLPQLLPLRIPHLHGGRNPTILDRHHAPTYTARCECLKWSVPYLSDCSCRSAEALRLRSTRTSLSGLGGPRSNRSLAPFCFESLCRIGPSIINTGGGIVTASRA